MKIFVFFSILLMMLGCDGRTEKHYHFNSSVISTAYGELGVEISGSLKNPDKFSRSVELANPYTLKVNFSSDGDDHNPVFVEDVKVISKNKGILYIFRGGNFERTWSDFDDTWFNSWEVKGLEISHEPVAVELKIGFAISGKNVEREYTIEFEPFYHEERR